MYNPPTCGCAVALDRLDPESLFDAFDSLDFDEACESPTSLDYPLAFAGVNGGDWGDDA